MSKILLVLSRKGLFQLTKCQNCGHVFECSNCDAKLTTYRSNSTTLELLCHQCQTYYKYPKNCPKCHSDKVVSKFGGIDELAEIINKELDKKAIRLDKGELLNLNNELAENPNVVSEIQVMERPGRSVLISPTLLEIVDEHDEIYLHTRLYDPSIQYDCFDCVQILQAENLNASPDYLVSEDTYKSITEVLLSINCKIYFDTSSTELSIFQNLIELNQKILNATSIRDWYQDFIIKEILNRQKYGFPPYQNLLLFTTQEKNTSASTAKLAKIKEYLIILQNNNLKEVQISSPYPARFLKRKNMYSHHLLLKYPRQYSKFKELRDEVEKLSELYNIQVRLNPRHLF